MFNKHCFLEKIVKDMFEVIQDFPVMFLVNLVNHLIKSSLVIIHPITLFLFDIFRFFNSNLQVARIREVVLSVRTEDGLYPNYLHPKSGKWGPSKFFSTMRLFSK